MTIGRKLQTGSLSPQVLRNNEFLLSHIPKSERLIVATTSSNWLSWVHSHCNLLLKVAHVEARVGGNVCEEVNPEGFLVLKHLLISLIQLCNHFVL